MIRRAAAAAVVMVALLGTAGCGVAGLSFVQDDRLSIVQPDDRETVDLPMTVRWTIEDFRVTGRTGDAVKDAGYFGVFVDRAPQAPGETVESLASDDAACNVDPKCPDEDYFAARGVFTTDETELTIDFLPELARGDNRDFHELTIVLLDGEGQRIGESAFRVEFEVAREES